jgi:hypothetical protein
MELWKMKKIRMSTLGLKEILFLLSSLMNLGQRRPAER